MAATGLGETAVLKYKKIPIIGGDETLTPVQEHRLRREVHDLRMKLEKALETQVLNQSYQDFIASVADRRVAVPDWVKVIKPGRRTATPTANLSDTHFGETIDAKQINYVNGYNREIGKRRLEKFFNGTARLAHQYLNGFDYPGLVLTLGGDMFSGNIHEELQRTNEGTLCEEILYWLEPMLSGIRFMADEFGKVLLPCVVGNHPRNTKKPAMKDRVRDNFDWLFYCLLKKFLMDDARITFLVSEAADIHYPIYNTKFCLTHGDQFRGGSGIAGFLSPLMIGDARKQKRASAMKMPYDYMVMGHWHQLAFFRRLIVNGSLKGYDEYASINNFDFEPPRQAFYLTDPQRGVTIQAPIHCQCSNEGWERSQDLLAA